MRNFKNKKKLTSLVIAFMLVFVMGSAFAFGPGQLGIAGFVGVAPDLSVIWQDNPVTSGTSATVTTNVAGRVNGIRDFQGINWAVGFANTGASATATLTAVAYNDGAVAAHITGLGFNPAPDFGVTATVSTTPTVAAPVVLAPGATYTFIVTLTWDGTTFPPITPALDLGEIMDLLEYYDFHTSFTLLFDYVRAP
jgi:hypothetical protein